MKSSSTGSLSERAYHQLQEKILRGEYPPGAALSRRLLAADLGMSLLPVSEALQRLEGDGLVESRPRVGTRVRIPSTKDIRGHYVVREALESQAARLFAEKASAEERDELHRMAIRLDRMNAEIAAMGDRTDPEQLYAAHRYHMRLHMRIAECTGCEPLCEAIEKNHVLVFNWFYDVAFRRRDLPARWHQQVVDTISKQRSDAADKSMRHHVRHGMEELLGKLELAFDRKTWRNQREPPDSTPPTKRKRRAAGSD